MNLKLIYSLINGMTKRKSFTFRLDERLGIALESIARKDNTSVNRTVENMLLEYLKAKGELSEDFQPLGETRGGSRKND